MNPTGISPKVALIGIALGIIVLALAADRVNTWRKTRNAVAEAVQPLDARIESTAGILADTAEADRERDEANRGADQAAADFRDDIERSRRNEPQTRSRADSPVPNSVRDAYRKRREAIQRSGCVGEQCREGSAAAPAR